MAEEADLSVDGLNAEEDEQANKKLLIQEMKPSENGLDDETSNGGKLVSINGVSGDTPLGSSECLNEEMETEASTLENGDSASLHGTKAIKNTLEEVKEGKDTTVKNEVAKSVGPAQSSASQVLLSDNAESDSVLSVGNSGSPVEVNTDDASPSEDNSSEVMEVDSEEGTADGDDNVVEVSSNLSAPVSDVVEIGDNNSKNPSLVSEDTSQDSLESVDSRKSKSEHLVGKVQGVEGDEILITVNNDDDLESKEDCETSEKVVEEIKNESKKSESDKILESEISSSQDSPKVHGSEPVASLSLVGPVVSVHPTTTQLFQGATVTVATSGVNFIPVQGGSIAIPAGYQLVQQGNQYGYITVVGNQRIFVPATTVLPASNVKNSLIANQLTSHNAQLKQANQKPQVKPENLQPKSSWEMIELMKWEIQNRIPDNYNWSVAFHKRKDDLSSITTFLQELGSDVVKEQVYKDIIQIQTKKRETGDLKDAEIESLEKMKTVYENTKKKVEHLQLETKECDVCKFKTESDVIMAYHRDFPHYDPPWDISRAWLICGQLNCDFKTKTVAHFIFHQKDIHNVQAKFLEKEQYFQCSLCPLNASTKNKLERHQQKCIKNFKLNCNLQPYYHDTNFCMKTCFYKPKKVVQKPPPPPPPKPTVRPNMLTRQQGSAPGIQLAISQPQTIRPQPNVSQPSNVAVRQRLPVVTQQGFIAHNQHPAARPRLAPPALQRAPVPPLQRPVRPAGKEMSGFEICELCGGYVKDRQALRIHFYYAHKIEMPQAIFNRQIPPLTCDVCKSNYWTTQGLAKHKSATQHYIGTKSKVPIQLTKLQAEQECFMCTKPYPNLFVHFERVHGMTMKDLVLVRKCIMCGFAASDYKTLESHLGNAHGILIKVNDYLVDKNKPAKVSPAVISGGKNVGKINYCVFCQIQYPDNIQLTIHCIKSHATCDKCGMVVASAAKLTEHTCRKAHINRSCYICGTVVSTQEKYLSHLRLHVKRCRVRLENLSEEEINEIKDKVKRDYKPAVISLDSDDSDIEVVETKADNVKKVQEQEDKKENNMVESIDSDEKKDSEISSKENMEKVDEENAIKSTVTTKVSEDADSERCQIGRNKTENPKKALSLVEEKNGNSSDTNVSKEMEMEPESHADVEHQRNNDTGSASEVNNDIVGPIQNVKCDDEPEHEIVEKIEEDKIENTTNNCAETEEEFEKRLLKKDENEDNFNTNSHKRKRSESEIDEAELLKDDDEIENTKRQKTKNGIQENNSGMDTSDISEISESLCENNMEPDMQEN